MRILHDFKDLAAVRGAALAIGNFDGVHLGHRAVIDEAGHVARADGLPWAVLTFEPHPRSLFAPDSPPFRLTPFPAKAQQVAALGVDAMVVIPFDRAFSRLSAETFVDDVLIGALGARHVVSGYDFVFGHNRGGDCEMLLRKGAEKGFTFTSVTALKDDGGEAYSSTRARHCLAAGDMDGAARILGRPFEIEGTVVEGDHRGRTIGFPTANIDVGDHVRPARGVYAVRVSDTAEASPVWRRGVANWGRRPTFDGTSEVLEVFLFDFDGDLYGRTLRVALAAHLRPERAFDGIESLKAQIAVDAQRARDILSRPGPVPPALAPTDPETERAAR